MTPPRILAWVPLAICVAIGVYFAIASNGAPAPDVLRASVEAAMHGHITPFLVAIVVATLVQIGIAIPFVLHMAENTALKSKGGWIVGGVLVASIVLPIYASKHLRKR